MCVCHHWSVHLGWVEDQVVDSARRWVDPPVLDPVHDCLERHVQIDHNVHRGFLLQGLCLCLGPERNLLSYYCWEFCTDELSINLSL